MVRDDYPPDHEFGMRVPRGGSDCAKCHWLIHPENTHCANKYYRRAMGHNRLLAPADEFCCDVFETENKKDSSRFYGEE